MIKCCFEENDVNLYFRHRCMHFNTTGVIVYDPERGTMSHNVEHWAIIRLEQGISDYYRYQFEKKYGIQLVKPSWEPHISVLKGYPEINKSVPWGWRNGEEIEVHYGHEIFWNKAHVWINTYTPAIDELRHHYGVVNARDNGHMTIGKFKNHEIGLLKEFGTYRDL